MSGLLGASLLQASGEIQYTADLPRPANTLYGAPAVVQMGDVGKAIASIDASAATAYPGVFGFVSAEDVAAIGAANLISVPTDHAKIFATGATEYVGQFVGLVLASSWDVAIRAAKLVVVHYEDTPALALEFKGHGQPKHAATITAGPEHGMPVPPPPTGAPVASVTGKTATTGQKHFFLETQVTFAVPAPNGQVYVQCASQAVQAVRSAVATALRKLASKVSVTTSQIGGAYGGKAFLPTSVACAVSVAAVKVNRPVLCQLDRNIDMLSMGGRPPASADFSVDIDTGSMKLTSLHLTATVDCGYDPGGSVSATSLNCYIVPGAKLSKQNVTTPTPMNTIMRAPGDFQGAFFMEAAIEAAARTGLLAQAEADRSPLAGLPLDDARPVQEANMDAGCADVWGKAKALDEAEGLYAGARTFNAANRWRKRGVWTMCVKYNLGNASYGQQATVNVNADGSISLAHTGLEMGQGMNTKAVQSVAYELGSGLIADPAVLLALVRTVSPTTTDGHNADDQTNTWGSGTSESVAFACLEACKTLKARLLPYKSPSATTWQQIVGAAASAGVVLSETHTKRKQVDGGNYLQYSSCVCVAEVDVLSGEVEVLRSDIFYDAGVALNPVIDIGQVEGSFVQGMGALLTEELVRDGTDHRLINNGTWDYKVPCPLDVPQVFNCTLMPNDVNTAKGAVAGSKASGEPAYLLGAAAFFAVKQAIYAARAEAQESAYFNLMAPATPAKVREACLVSLAGEHARCRATRARDGASDDVSTRPRPCSKGEGGGRRSGHVSDTPADEEAGRVPMPPVGSLLRRRPAVVPEPAPKRRGHTAKGAGKTTTLEGEPVAPRLLLDRRASGLALAALLLFAFGALAGAVAERRLLVL